MRRRAFGWVGLALLGFVLDTMAATHTAQLKLARQGVPLNWPVPLELALFGTATGGVALATWNAEPTPFEDGLVTLDFSTGPDTLENRALWLEVRVVESGSSTPTILSPRVALTAVPVAVVAARPVAGSVGTPAINPDQVQRRITLPCPAHAPRLTSVSSLGHATTCTTDRGIEGISPGLGIDLVNGSLVGLDFGEAQRRRTPQCGPGTAIRQIPVAGTPVCVPDANPLRGLTRVTSTCTFPGTQGIETGCAATPRCPTEAPVPINGGQSADCVAAKVNASYPVNDGLGGGWTSWMIKPDDTVCSATVNVTAFVYCVAGP